MKKITFFIAVATFLLFISNTNAVSPYFTPSCIINGNFEHFDNDNLSNPSTPPVCSGLDRNWNYKNRWEWGSKIGTSSTVQLVTNETNSEDQIILLDARCVNGQSIITQGFTLPNISYWLKFDYNASSNAYGVFYVIFKAGGSATTCDNNGIEVVHDEGNGVSNAWQEKAFNITPYLSGYAVWRIYFSSTSSDEAKMFINNVRIEDVNNNTIWYWEQQSQCTYQIPFGSYSNYCEPTPIPIPSYVINSTLNGRMISYATYYNTSACSEQCHLCQQSPKGYPCSFSSCGYCPPACINSGGIPISQLYGGNTLTGYGIGNVSIPMQNASVDVGMWVTAQVQSEASTYYPTTITAWHEPSRWVEVDENDTYYAIFKDQNQNNITDGTCYFNFTRTGIDSNVYTISFNSLTKRYEKTITQNQIVYPIIWNWTCTKPNYVSSSDQRTHFKVIAHPTYISVNSNPNPSSAGQTVNFYAFYNCSGSFVCDNNTIPFPTCIISFDNFATNYSMTYNDTSGRSEFSRSFSTEGNYQYKTSCSKENYDSALATYNHIVGTGICDAKYICISNYTRAYQLSNCSIINQQDCTPLYCNNGICTPNLCDAGWTCLNSTHKAYMNSTCSVTTIEYCQYGCLNGVCKAYTGTCAKGYYCISPYTSDFDYNIKCYMDENCQFSECIYCNSTTGGYCSNGQCLAKQVPAWSGSASTLDIVEEILSGTKIMLAYMGSPIFLILLVIGVVLIIILIFSMVVKVAKESTR